ncbi:MAG: hypothetical protein WED05_08965 [Candidatus Atabeyarchaeum deiterrae]
MSEHDEPARQASIIVKLILMQTRAMVDGLKAELLKTDQQRKAYEALDGKRLIDEIAQFAGYTDNRQLESVLPLWERRGLILSSGKARSKKYVNLDNLDV